MNCRKGVRGMFRYRKSVALSYDEQAHIYYYSRLYRRLPKEKQAKIRMLCREAGGQHHKALLVYVTGGMKALEVCGKYYISQSTLDRIVRRYYLLFPVEL